MGCGLKRYPPYALLRPEEHHLNPLETQTYTLYTCRTPFIHPSCTLLTPPVNLYDTRIIPTCTGFTPPEPALCHLCTLCALFLLLCYTTLHPNYSCSTLPLHPFYSCCTPLCTHFTPVLHPFAPILLIFYTLFAPILLLFYTLFAPILLLFYTPLAPTVHPASTIHAPLPNTTAPHLFHSQTRHQSQPAGATFITTKLKTKRITKLSAYET